MATAEHHDPTPHDPATHTRGRADADPWGPVWSAAGQGAAGHRSASESPLCAAGGSF